MAEVAWFEDPDFWRDMRPKVYTPNQRAAAHPEAVQILNLLEIKQRSTILDMCCGNGRHSIEFNLLGHDVTGADLNQAFIAEAREQATLRNANPHFVVADMRTFQSDMRFDFIVILWNAFGYFGNDADDLHALRSMNHALNADGKLLIQTHGRESTARKFVKKDWFEIGETIVFDQRWIEGDWSIMRTRYVIITPTHRREHIMSCRLYSPTNLQDLLKTAGFSDIRFMGGLDGCPYDEKAFELVAIATKRV